MMNLILANNFYQPMVKKICNRISGISNLQSTKLLLFPNPADGFFTVEYNLTDPFNKAVLVVFDISGKMVVQQEIHYDTDQVLIPSENWPAGQYTTARQRHKTNMRRKRMMDLGKLSGF